MNEKICNTCKIIKPITEFYTKGNMGRNKCKQCYVTVCSNDGCNNRATGGLPCTECYRKKRGTKKKHLKIVGMKQWLSGCLASTRHCSKARKARHYKLKENNLTIEFLMDLYDKQDGKCFVSRMQLASEYKNIRSASIDRIDPEVGYLQDNVVLTCQWVNMGRNRCPLEEFRSILVGLDQNLIVRSETILTTSTSF